MMSLSRALITVALPCLVSAQSGFSPIFGGLHSGSGLALGLEYRKSGVVVRPLDFTVRGIGSVKRYEFLEAGFALPRLAGGRLFADTTARYRNFPEEDFWGLGPASPKDGRTNFRLEDIDYSLSFGFRPVEGVEAGVTVGSTYVNTGPGKDGDWPSIEQRFTASEVPALERQSDYFHWGAFLRADRRDEPGDPRRGGFYQFRWTSYRDRDSRLYDFRRYEIDLRHFFPVFWERDTLAFRARTILSEKRSGRQVPFFLQPALGGGDLRGYDPGRFRDENALVLNLEYRWRIREMVQAVGFADAGRVFHRPRQIGLAGLRFSTGVGARFKLGNRILLGADLGWSPEGLHLRFRTAHSF